MMYVSIQISDIPIIGNYRFINQKAVDYDDRFSFSIIDHRMPAQNMQ